MTGRDGDKQSTQDGGQDTGNASSPWRHVLVAGLLLVWLGLGWQSYNLTLAALFSEQEKSGNATLDVYGAALRGSLEKYRALPRLLSRHPLVTALMHDMDNPEKVQDVNILFGESKVVTGAAEIYLMRAGATTIAASNAYAPVSFIGANFAYRPYYQQAIEGRLGRYFAQGTTSKKRGYYFSYPIWAKHQIAGVITVKVDIDALETLFQDTPRDAVVTDKHGIVFMATRPEWRFHSLTPLGPKDIQEVENNRQYGDVKIEPLDWVYQDDGTIKAVEIRDKRKTILNWRKLDKPLTDIGWTVSLLLPVKTLYTQALAVAAIVMLVVFGTGVIIRNAIQRRRDLADRLELQRQARRNLEQSAHELERRVEERTRELRKTQDELIHAAKLAALGRMSAGISHELNQPLTAIRAYNDTAVKFIDKNRPENAKENLGIINDLVARMSEIIRYFRTFAREGDPTLEVFNLTEVIENIKRFMGPRLQREGVTLLIRSNEKIVPVRANQTRMEQVLVNIVGNALDAMREADSPAKRIEISLGIDHAKNQVRLAVRDYGPGLSANVASHVFDPFFTTKEAGDGLGLGLSISYNIVKDFDGSLQVENHPQGGAIFTVTLPIAKEDRLKQAI